MQKSLVLLVVSQFGYILIQMVYTLAVYTVIIAWAAQAQGQNSLAKQESFNMTKTTTIARHIKALTIFYILDDLADWILDPFMACEGVIDG